jgi:hypothetical protein
MDASVSAFFLRGRTEALETVLCLLCACRLEMGEVDDALRLSLATNPVSHLRDAHGLTKDHVAAVLQSLELCELLQRLRDAIPGGDDGVVTDVWKKIRYNPVRHVSHLVL